MNHPSSGCVCVGATPCRRVPLWPDARRLLTVNPALCFFFLSSKPMGQKNRKLAFLCAEGSGAAGRQVITLLSLSAKAPVTSDRQYRQTYPSYVL